MNLSINFEFEDVMPNCLLLYIAKKYFDSKDLCNGRLVNKRWHAVLSDNAAWRSVFAHDYPFSYQKGCLKGRVFSHLYKEKALIDIELTIFVKCCFWIGWQASCNSDYEMSVPDNNYKSFLVEASKTTLFCLGLTGLFKVMGASNRSLLIIFNMAVMSSAALFSFENKPLYSLILGSGSVVLSVVAGGMIGYYHPLFAQFLTIVYAGLAFLIPKNKTDSTIFVTGALVFVVFTGLPFNWEDAFQYTLDGTVLVLTFTLFHYFFDSKVHKKLNSFVEKPIENKLSTALVAVCALALACTISDILYLHTSFTHLYWIELTALLVIQGSQQRFHHQKLLTRLSVNIVGAVLAILLFKVLPAYFWLYFALLTLFLFMIFALGFSYTGRILFIELFVLGFALLVGEHETLIALDRIVLTFIGCTIGAIASLFFYFFAKEG